MTYPIAEVFHSIQGEGHWTGTQMMFVRLAGCNVGRYAESRKTYPNFEIGSDPEPFFSLKHSICTTYDNQRFLCDTDYHKQLDLTVEDLIDELKDEEEHVCLTGGEPFLHDVGPLVVAFQREGLTVHIETSCTKPINLPCDCTAHQLWITCSPKSPLLVDELAKVNEVKILVGPIFNEDQFDELCSKLDDAVEVYLQPINGVNELCQENMTKAKELVMKRPRLKLSVQLHKILGVR